jgi:sugar phosphate isomerase/epimerase
MNLLSPTDLSKLCIHTATTKPLTIEEAVKFYSEYGVRAMTIWRDAIQGKNLGEIRKLIEQNNLEVVSLCRGGFFPSASDAKRKEAIDDNIKAIDEAVSIGAPMIVLVCGAEPKQSLETSRLQIKAGLESILPIAEEKNIKLAIEPLHPMYADDRSAINTLKQANDMAEYFNSPWIGVAVDVYHVWWDPDLRDEIIRCGERGNLFAFHICDWKVPTVHILLDRGLMGEGCINIPQIRGWVEETGFDGFHEVEIFSEKYWKSDQTKYIKNIIEAYKKFA